LRRAASAGNSASNVSVQVHVHLEVHVERRPAGIARQPIEAARQIDRIDRLYDLEQLDCPTGLVRLQRADEVPAGARHEGRLGLGLLNPVLTEQRQSGRDSRV
jgi:hypothetical protein